MTYLLDTYTFILFVNGDRSLPKRVVGLLESGSSECVLSIVSIWEIAIKVSLNKLRIKGHFDQIPDILEANEIKVLGLDFYQVNAILNLPFHHRDPFDRMIIAQAKAGEMTILTRDKHFTAYGVPVVWE